LAGAALVLVNVLLIFVVIAAFRHLGGAGGGSEATYGLARSAAQSPEKQSSPARNTESAPAGGTEKMQERAPATGLPSLSPKPASRRRTAASGSPNAVSGTFWNNDGSIFKLEASGRVRRFYFANPGPGVAAKAGSLAFEGVREGQSFSGQVFLFNENCAPLGYTVRGSASADEATVRLHGKKPRRDAQCAVSGYDDSELVFTLANSLSKQEASFHR
jgi:hypothetical protein